MPPRRAPNRPPTSKEARRAYLKRGGSSYMSDEERQRLIRAQEREEQRLEKVKKEAARHEAAKKRAETAARQREERRRLGLPDPSVKISPGQMRIGGFLKGREVETALDEKFKANVDEQQGAASEGARGDVDGQPLPAERLASPLLQEENHDSEPEDTTAVGIEHTFKKVDSLISAASEAATALPPIDLGSSFFASNSQIARDLNGRVPTSPIDCHPVNQAAQEQDGKRTPTPKATGARRIKTPEQAEIENLLLGIPSQELNCLSSSPPS